MKTSHSTESFQIFNTQIMVETFKNCLNINPNQVSEKKDSPSEINNNYSNVTFNVDGNSLDTPTRAGYCGLLHNSVGFYLS